MDLALVDAEAQGGADDLPALEAAGSRIDGEHVVLEVPDHLKDMGVAADEDLRAVVFDQGAGAKVVAPGVTSYMGHQHAHSSAFEELVGRILKPDVLSVTIAADPDKGLETGDFTGGFGAPSEISRMPYLVDRRQEFPEFGAEHTVGVGYEAYEHVKWI